MKYIKDYERENNMTDSEVEKHYADLRKEAITFGEWILKHDSYPISNDTWLVARGEDPVTREEAYSYVTTEQLYEEFIKSLKKQ